MRRVRNLFVILCFRSDSSKRMYALEVLSNFFSVWITIIFCICNSPFNNFIGIISSWRLYAEFHTAITAPIRNTINAIALVNVYLRILIYFLKLYLREICIEYIYNLMEGYIYINVYKHIIWIAWEECIYRMNSQSTTYKDDDLFRFRQSR